MSESDSRRYVDIQPLLAAAEATLPLGQLVKTDDFRLQDAMLAIEIGDPKMDIGIQKVDNRSAAERIAAGEAPVELSLSQSLAVLDRLMAMEASWHKGAMLPQSVFTSLYILDIYRIQSNQVMFAGCLAVRAITAFTYNMILSGQVCDEDDIAMHNFGIEVDAVDEQYLQKVIKSLEEGIRFLKKNSNRPSGATEERLTKDACSEALLWRLSFRLNILRGLSIILYPFRRCLSSAAEFFDAAKEILDTIESTALQESVLESAPGFAPDVHHKAMPMVPPRATFVISFPSSVTHWRNMLESMSLGCRLIAKCTSWSQLQSQLLQFAAGDHHPVVRSLVYRSLVFHQQLKENEPDPTSNKIDMKKDESVGLITICSSSGEMPDYDDEDVVWTPTKQRLQAEFGWDAPPGEMGKVFIEQLSIAVLGWCHTMCLNRCRQRRRLRRLLEDWRNMMDHAFTAETTEEVRSWFVEKGWAWTPSTPDGIPFAGPLVTRIEIEASRTMLAYLMLGVPLELYAPHELCSLYWYCDYLLNALQQGMQEFEYMYPSHALQNSTGIDAKAQESTRTSRTKYAGGKRHNHQKKKTTAKKHQSKEVGKPTSSDRDSDGMIHHQSDPSGAMAIGNTIVMSRAMQIDRFMCQGMIRLALALRVVGLVDAPASGFVSEEQWFQQRFGCFSQIVRPEMLTYDQFKVSTEATNVSAETLLVMALDAFLRAQSAVVHLTEGSFEVDSLLSNHLTGVSRIAKANSVAIKLLVESISRAKDNEKLPFQVALDFGTALQLSVANFFPSLILKRAK